MILTFGSLITEKQRKTTIETTSYYFRYFLNAVDAFKLNRPDKKNTTVFQKLAAATSY